MRKIKSALELAMERTAALTGEANKENRSPELDQYIKAARTLAGSFLEGKIEPARVAESMARYPAAAAEAAKRAFLETAAGGMTLENCSAVREALLVLRPDQKDGRAAGLLRNIDRRFRESLAAQRTALEEKGGAELAAHLREKGIGGGAVAGFNLDRHPAWQVKQAEIAATFAAELEKAGEELAALTSGR